MNEQVKEEVKGKVKQKKRIKYLPTKIAAGVCGLSFLTMIGCAIVMDRNDDVERDIITKVALSEEFINYKYAREKELYEQYKLGNLTADEFAAKVDALTTTENIRDNSSKWLSSEDQQTLKDVEKSDKIATPIIIGSAASALLSSFVTTREYFKEEKKSITQLIRDHVADSADMEPEEM